MRCTCCHALHEDNQAVVWILTNWVTRSPELMAELRKLWYVLDAYDIELRPTYIRSAANVVADFASRLAFSGDYVLAQARFLALQAAWGECTVDAFASPATALPEPWSDRLTANPGQRLTVPDSLTALTALSLTV